MGLKNGTLVVLPLLETMTQGEIAQRLNLPKQTVSRWTMEAQHLGLIAVKIRSRPLFYQLTDKGREVLRTHHTGELSPIFSLGVRTGVQSPQKQGSLKRLKHHDGMAGLMKKKYSIHHLRVKLPIIEDAGIFKAQKEVRINHWVKKYIYGAEELPFEMTLEKTQKSIIVHLAEKELPFTPESRAELMSWLLRSVELVKTYLHQKQGLKVDINRMKVISQHIGNPAEDFDEAVDKTVYESVELGRPAESPTGVLKDKAGRQKEGKAWLDRSDRGRGRKLEAETNDLAYEHKLLMMPEHIDQLHDRLPELMEYGHQITRHLQVMEEMSLTLAEIRKALNGGVHDSKTSG